MYKITFISEINEFVQKALNAIPDELLTDEQQYRKYVSVQNYMKS